MTDLNGQQPYTRRVFLSQGLTLASLAATAPLFIQRSAFGLQGQKCSACSVAYVEKSVHKDFLHLLRDKTAKIKIGNPESRDAVAKHRESACLMASSGSNLEDHRTRRNASCDCPNFGKPERYQVVEVEHASRLSLARRQSKF